MTKAELIDRIARNRDLPPDVTKKVIAQILDITFAELAAYFVRTRVTKNSNPRFAFPKFGTFIKKTRSGRRGVNPRTLEPMDIEACDTVDFKPSTELKRQLNEPNAKGRSKAKKKPKKKAKKKATRKKTAKASAKRKSTKKTTAAKKKKASGPSGRKLVTREEAELELPGAPILPDAPLQRVSRRRRKSPVENTG